MSAQMLPGQLIKSPSILIVDDEPDNFDVIEALLNDRDYKLHYAASGQRAIKSLGNYKPDVILLDVMMPQMDGMQVCAEIKAMPQWRPVPIIMVTSLNAKEDLARCLQTGADDFISKPINSLELRSRLQSMLRIKQQYDEVQTLLQLREDMMNMVIHDLRNPLTGVLHGLELLKNPIYPPEKVANKLAETHSSAQKLQMLIDELLQVARIESGNFCLNCTDVNLCDLINSAVANFEPIAAQKDQALIVQCPIQNNQMLCIDAIMMHRTIDNLLSNAIKFSPDNSQIMVNLEFLNSGPVRIQVIDSGPGVPEALQKRIFEKYEIGTLMPGVSQIGLGLAFCKMVVEAHQGKICVRNNHPQGSIFEITLGCFA